VVSSTTIKNPKTEGRKKFITNVCCLVGSNNKDLIRNIAIGFGLL